MIPYSKIKKSLLICNASGRLAASPRIRPAVAVSKPANKNENVIKKGCVPVVFKIAISFRLSIISMIIAEEMLIDATKRIKNIIKSNKFFDVSNE